MQQVPPRPLVSGGGVEIGDERGWRRGRHWRCTGDEIKMIKRQITMKKHKNFIKNMLKTKVMVESDEP